MNLNPSMSRKPSTSLARLGSGKSEWKNCLKSVDLKRLKTWLWKKRSFLELDREKGNGQVRPAFMISDYLTGPRLSRAVTGWGLLLSACPGCLRACVSGGFLGSGRSSTAHTDSTLLLTGATASMKSKHTCKCLGMGTRPRHMLLYIYTQIHTSTNDG